MSDCYWRTASFKQLHLSWGRGLQQSTLGREREISYSPQYFFLPPEKILKENTTEKKLKKNQTKIKIQYTSRELIQI